MNTTKILGEAVGIQRQDIIDRTEEQTADGLTGAVILGRFKRGRFDAPMEIHLGNIRGQLGYDPKNPDYIAVQDCLDTNVPSVQVLRVKESIENAICVGATKKITLGTISSGGYYNIKINNILHEGVISFRDGREDLKSIFALYGIEVKPLNSAFQEVISNGGIYNEVEYASFFHPANSHVDIEIITVDASKIDEYIVDDTYGENETVLINSIGVTFCLN
ncbi:hypothetical protein D3C79_301310 [compost metagenome]